MKLKGYSDYEIDVENGTVWSYKSNRYIGSTKNKGYWECTLYDDNGKGKHWRFNRLIWTVVNGEIPDGMEINHIDENKNNNSIGNLSLMSPKENKNWGTRNKRISNTKINGKKSKSVIAIKDNSIVIYYPSTREAGRNGFQQSHIGKCCRGEHQTHKGYKWMYLDDYLADWWDKEMDKALN